jgi:hypothetical protein
MSCSWLDALDMALIAFSVDGQHIEAMKVITGYFGRRVEGKVNAPEPYPIFVIQA